MAAKKAPLSRAILEPYAVPDEGRKYKYMVNDGFSISQEVIALLSNIATITIEPIESTKQTVYTKIVTLDLKPKVTGTSNEDRDDDVYQISLALYVAERLASLNGPYLKQMSIRTQDSEANYPDDGIDIAFGQAGESNYITSTWTFCNLSFGTLNRYRIGIFSEEFQFASFVVMYLLGYNLTLPDSKLATETGFRLLGGVGKYSKAAADKLRFSRGLYI